MRAPFLTVLSLTTLAALTGCSSDGGVGFTLRAVLDAETDGVRLLDDGSTGHAAMIDQLCTFDVDAGEVTGDLDLGPGQEVLMDAEGGDTLARLGGELHRIDAAGTETDRVGIEAIDARLVGDRIVALVDHDAGCTVAWVDSAREQTAAWAIPETDCSGAVAFDVDRRTGAAWLTDGSHVAQVTPDGTFTRVEADADLVVWDASTGGAVIGATGLGWVQGIDAQGTDAWTRSFDGSLSDLATAGSAGIIAVMMGESEGGALELLDSADGDLTHRYRLPETADVAMSSSGRDMALVTDDRVFLYDVETDTSLVDTPSARGASREDTWLGVGRGTGTSGATAMVGTAIAVMAIVD